jgi:hypothetical protein
MDNIQKIEGWQNTLVIVFYEAHVRMHKLKFTHPTFASQHQYRHDYKRIYQIYISCQNRQPQLSDETKLPEEIYFPGGTGLGSGGLAIEPFFGVSLPADAPATLVSNFKIFSRTILCTPENK